MESSKEKIEAQLCAYIEGELNDAERAEIERHLQTNPQHKALIVELREQRDLLQTLPRATIPGELNENLTGQLERSSLLGDDDETAEAGAGINRWPQFTAIAAVLLLAAGLGVVVFFVLPPANSGRGPVAMEDGAVKRLPSSAPASANAVVGDPPAPATSPLRDADATHTLAESPRAAAPAPIASAGGLAGTDVRQQSVPLRELTSGPGLVSSSEVAELQKRMGQAIGGDANEAFHLGPDSSLYLVVQAPDPAVANGQVTAFFKSNSIQYMNYEEGVASGAFAGGEPRLGHKPLASATGPTGRGADPAAGSGPGAAIGGGLYGGAFGTGRERSSAAGAAGAPSGGREAENPMQPGVASAEAQRVDRGYARAPQPEARGLGLGGGGGGGSASAVAEPAKPADKKQAVADVAKRPSAKENQVASASDAERLADRDRTPAPAEAKAKADSGTAAGQGIGGPKDELSLRQKVEAASKPADSSADSFWAMRTAGRVAAIDRLAADAGARGGVIIARMNRRQANDLSVALSREGGQRAELREFSTLLTGPVAGAQVVPAVDSAERMSRGERSQAGQQAPTTLAVVETRHAAAAPTSRPAGGGQLSAQLQDGIRPDGLTLSPQPSDEPVDVVIVVKTAPTPAASEAPKPTDELKAGVGESKK